MTVQPGQWTFRGAFDVATDDRIAGRPVHDAMVLLGNAAVVLLRRLIRRSAATWVALAIVLCSTAAARAEFSVCNQTLDVVNVAIGQQRDDVFRTEGWWTIGSNQCANVIREDLRTRYVYVYATDVFGMRTSGAFPDPGKVHTRLYYQNRLIEWAAGRPADEHRTRGTRP